MAATDKITGKDGTVTYNSTQIAITDFSVTVEGDVQDVTDSSSASAGWEENIPNGFRRWSGSFSGFVLDGTATPTIAGAAASLVLLAETGVTWTGNAILNSKTIDSKVKGTDAVKMTVNFTGTGALTEANS